MKDQIVEKIATLVAGAFALVAALAWNDAIKKLFEQYYPKGDSLGAHMSYAIFVTVVAVIATVWIGRIAGKKEEKK